MKKNSSLQKALLPGLTLLSLTFLTLFSISCGDSAAVTTTEKLTPMEDGRALFVSYCKICHGENGQPGPMAELLDMQAGDLSLISDRRGGQFPEEEVFQVIDGRKPVVGHGDEMPVWWETLKEAERLETDEQVKEKIDHLVLYLKSIQK